MDGWKMAAALSLCRSAARSILVHLDKVDDDGDGGGGGRREGEGEIERERRAMIN